MLAIGSSPGDVVSDSTFLKYRVCRGYYFAHDLNIMLSSSDH